MPDPQQAADQAPVVAAVITAAVAVLLTALGQFETWRRERVGRRYDRRRVALLDVQDAALGVRRALRVYGAALHDAVAGATGVHDLVAPVVDDRELADAQGLLEVRRVRLDDDADGRAVDDALSEWVETSREHFLSPADTTASAEQVAWDAVNDAVARALRA